MGSCIHIFYTEQKKADEWYVTGDEKQTNKICELARELAAKQNVDMPKHISCGGDRSGWTYICYNKNSVKNMIIQALEHLNLPYMMNKEYTFEGFRAKLKELKSS